VSNLILTAEGWQQRIRDKVGVPEAYLPDSLIEQPDCIMVAEANIIEMIPNYADLTGIDRVYLEAATVCECARLLCPSMSARLPQREQGPHFTHEIVVDWDAKKRDLEEDRDSYLSKIPTVAASWQTVPHFQVHNHRR